MKQYRFNKKEHAWLLHRKDASKRYLKDCSTCSCSYESNRKAGRFGPCCRQEPCLKCLLADAEADRALVRGPTWSSLWDGWSQQ